MEETISIYLWQSLFTNQKICQLVVQIQKIKHAIKISSPTSHIINPTMLQDQSSPLNSTTPQSPDEHI
jgi:hypothetical protein